MGRPKKKKTRRSRTTEETNMGMLDKMMGKKEPVKQEYKPELMPGTQTISGIKVDGTDNPEKLGRVNTMPGQGNSPESPQDAPTVPLLAKYDEGQVMQIQLMQELLGQMQKNTAMLVKIYEFFIEQSKK